MSGTAHDREYMARALGLAARGLYTTRPNPRVGCVLVREGVIVGEGWHERAGLAHAEVVALAAAGARARGATAYVTLEPCAHQGRTPACTSALIAAGVARVVYAITDPNPRVAGAGALTLAAAGIALSTGCLAEEATALNAGFLKRQRTGRPWLRLKVGASLDGRTALADGTSRWITSEESRADVQRLRALSGAVLTGAGTVRADDPRLTVRDARYAANGLEPLKVLLAGRTPVARERALFATATLVFVPDPAPDWARALAGDGVEVHAVAACGAGVALGPVLEELARREVNEVLAEVGPTLAGALITQGLVDELVLYLAPCLLGESAQPLARLGTLGSLAQRVRMRILEACPIGPDLRLTLVAPTGGEG